MADIILVRSNSVILDPRVRKIVRSLSKRYSLLVLGWNREGISSDVIGDYPVELKLFPLRAPFGKLRLVFFLPLFWMWVFSKLVLYKPSIIHACDLDTASPSYVYKTIFRKKLIFDIFDRYAMTFIPKNFKLIYSTINCFEEFLCRKSDAVILVGKNILNTFKKIPKCIFIIANYPEEYSVNIKKSDESVLRLFYIGYISKHRGIERTIDAIKNLDRVEFVIVGRIMDREFFNQIYTIPNVKYKGELSHQEASTEEANSDAIVVLYDLQVKGNALAYPNKTYEAMMFKIPLITNMLPELITETDCGIIVDYNNLNQIKNAIINLRDNKELRERLGANGRRAFEQRCNWSLMEQELYKIYNSLLGN